MQADPERLHGAARIVADAVQRGDVPGAAVGVAVGGRVVLREAFGWAALDPVPDPVTVDHLFDLASLTKVVATTPLVMRLLAAGTIRLDDPLQQFGPDFALPGIRLSHLLTHTSGLPAWLDLTRHPDRAGRLAAIREAPRMFTAGRQVLYSDLNYILLGYLMEDLYGQSLAEAFQRQVAEPLGLADTRYGPVDAARAAATERDPATGHIWRGVVHDENARAAGGVSGHAGLFGTVADLLRFGQMFLDEGRTAGGGTYVSPAVLRAWIAPRTRLEAGEIRAYGFQNPHPLSSAGDFLSPQAVGHTGFTGTSLWIDPAYDVVLVLLTNRVHPTRANQHHIRLRPRFHNAVMGALRP
jgi:CubicO group peptidase (beta-lactamase class C family)